MAIGGALALARGAAAVPSQEAQGPNKLIVSALRRCSSRRAIQNCILRSRFHRGDPVGWRMFVADPQTGNREETAQLVVHVNYAGKTVDIPMRYRATAQQPERQFWVAKWMVPADAPVGIVRYTVTATDKYGRSGEFKPFEVQASQLTIVE